jgi:hypothetical protein
MSSSPSVPRVFALAAVVVALPMACVLDEVNTNPSNAPGSCVPTEDFFQDDVWNAFMSTDCYACHNAQGLANDTSFVLQNANQPGYLKNNLAVVEGVGLTERSGESILLLKPTMRHPDGHEGGERFTTDSDQYRSLESLVERFNNPVQCEVEDVGNPFEGVIQLDNEDTFRKATINLAGRLPTEEELALVRDGDVDDLRSAIDGVMSEEAFYARMKEVFNDLFLTDRYLGGNDATNLLDNDDFPNRRFYDDLDPAVYASEYIEMADDYTNNSVAREPLELIEHILRNDLPWTELILADYFMVNGYSAQVYDVRPETPFDNPADPNEFRPARLDGVPHAGVLTSPMFLNRFPTTDTNRNRHRSRMTYQFFLATNILTLADRPVASGDIIGTNPTRDNPNCTVCHENMDPIAGAYQNWDSRGRYRGPPTDSGIWYDSMLPPGYKGEVMPVDAWPTSLQWLAERMAADPLYALSAVHNVYTGLTGQAPLSAPADPSAADFDARSAAFEAQNDLFQELASKFEEQNYDLKYIVREIVIGPYFRAADATIERAELDDIGMARFLTPEMLDRKIEAVFGTRWARGWDGRSYLRDSNEFMIFYGGIDSDGVTTRITAPNGLMSSVARRLSNEMACWAGPRDFLYAPEDRVLFPHVEMGFTPKDENGFVVEAAVTAIENNIRYLHERFLGERLDPADPELERTYQLFFDTWEEGTEKLANDEVSRDVSWSCRGRYDPYTGEELAWEDQIGRDDNYTLRAWMAVLSYLMLDYRFLHE